jgi:type III secretion protein V
MRAGVIDMDEARRRRGMVEKESQLYGAMDGAMKFVKGDAIAGLISIAVNLLGGIAIGSFQQGMPFSEAIQVYSILTIGDGLVGQIPALFTSITAGFIVTRVTNEGSGSNLGDEIGLEVTAQPTALMVAACIMMIFAAIPGFPVAIFMTMAAASGGGGYLLWRKNRTPQADSDTFAGTALSTVPAAGLTPAKQRAGAGAEPDEFSLTVPVMVDVGTDILSIMRPEVLNETLAQVRRALYFDLGVPFPGISLRLNERYNGGGYCILLNEVPCGEGFIRPGHLLARDTLENLDILGIPAETDKPFLPLIETVWVSFGQRLKLEAGGVACMEPAQILSYHIAHVLRRYAEEFIGIQEARFMLSRMEDRFPELVKEVQRVLPLQRISEILQRLVSEGVSVRNMRAILTALIDWGQKEKDAVLLTEHVRGALKRQICYRHSSGMNIIPAYVVTPELEDIVRSAIRQTSSGSYLALDPKVARQIVDRVRSAMGSTSRKPVLLTAMDTRRYLRKIIESECPDLHVISYQELTPEITVQPLARLSL